MSRKRIATYGKRGALVRVDDVRAAGVRRYIVQWGSKAARQQESFPGTPAGRQEAIAFAEGYEAESRRPKAAEPAPALTTGALWGLFVEATWPHIRPRSQALYAENWKRWVAYFGRERLAGSMMVTDANGFRISLESAGLATRTIKAAIDAVRMVYNFAERAELIERNRWHQFRFRVAKERRTKPRAEYTEAEFLTLWRQFDPTSRTQWRAWVTLGLLGIYGQRQTATLHLQDPADVDEVEGVIVFRAEWDKTGEERVLPLLPITREILAVARAWRERIGYTGPWLIPSARAANQGETYTIQSFWSALGNAETRAGIDKIRFRAGHGFRRGLVGDLLADGADIELALKAIGDSDIRMSKHYAVKRNERIEKALSTRAARIEGATKGQPMAENSNADRPVVDDRRALNLEPSTT